MNDNLETDFNVSLQYTVTAALQRIAGMNAEIAVPTAAAVCNEIRAKFGGAEIYIPAPSKTQRNEHIRREFNGANLDEICRKYQLGKSRIYEIVGRSKSRRAK